MKLVFIHGAGAWGGVWHKQITCFRDAEAITLPGHPEGELCKSVAEYADWLHQFIKHNTYRNVILAGHSLGGAVVMSYTLKYPDALRAIILVATGAKLRVQSRYLSKLQEAVRGNPDKWVERMKDEYSKIPAEEQEALIKKYLEIGPSAQLNDLLCCDKFDVMEMIHRISVPALVICGDQDVMTPVKFTDYLAEKIPGAKKVIIPGATHQLFLEKPAEFNRALNEFIGTLNR